MREIVHIQAGQCGNQIGAKVHFFWGSLNCFFLPSFRCSSLKLGLQVFINLELHRKVF